ncbi:hypothetical protein PpBr36_05317 [Pyricularia pennisetigena]|uniref:hypothetical protein n=1 Tax=Pyricularia pennisetigena TaxID=1578925 RepID=UPI0011547052|nr:hypothetical protein PpBr36_05317 [Pyricularia pennisetigena]TLS27323.1 hypothetical protein PpBr36_05317 [Pyricularia pennisetigena]
MSAAAHRPTLHCITEGSVLKPPRTRTFGTVPHCLSRKYLARGVQEEETTTASSHRTLPNLELSLLRHNSKLLAFRCISNLSTTRRLTTTHCLHQTASLSHWAARAPRRPAGPAGHSDAMAPAGSAEKKADKSYFSSAVDSMNPWGGSRSTTPTPKEPVPPTPPPPPATSNPGDHSINYVYGQSTKRYPPDCPPLNVKWFHAVDIPKRKPKFLRSKKPIEDPKPPPAPKKLVPFAPEDSRSIEATYQTILEDLEKNRGSTTKRPPPTKLSRRPQVGSGDSTPRTTDHHIVYVQEDFLFQVDIEDRELAPVYWLGPIYDVRRGTWFYQEGSTLRPCEENLAAQLEEGYLKAKPWTYPPRNRSNSGTQNVTPKASNDNLRAAAAGQAETASKPAASAAPQVQHQPHSHRLFGTYMNSVATYQDSTVAWLTSDSVLSWVTSTVYERFAGGGYMSGVKLVRGYSEPNKAKEKESPDGKGDAKADVKEGRWPSTPPADITELKLDEKQQKLLKRRSAPPSTKSPVKESEESRDKELLTSLMGSADKTGDQEEEDVRRKQEKQMQNDYNTQAGENQGRDIDHLFLVTHGIGQLLGLRMESVNFVHDVNILRKTLKGVYSNSADLKALNSDNGDGPGNCRIQVLPVCWRHLLDFPKKREKKREHDLGETYTEEDEYPSLEDITVEGVAFARSLISDLALDVLLYQSAYREQIAHIVQEESNRVYNLFLERNPGFKGKVHVIGHSLGSAIMFDILCRQKEDSKTNERNPLRIWPSQGRPETSKDPRELKFDFQVEDLYCLGSPIGLFQMLKGRTIAARHMADSFPSESPLDPDTMEDPFLSADPTQRVSTITGLPFSISSPKVKQLFNVFHPSDPIAYRMEPLITPAMSSLKSQVLPYTKKGIFGSVAPQGITGIGVKVGQSVSGLWSSLSAGIASNILNRSLGLTQEDVANMQQQQQNPTPSSGAAGTNISSATGVLSDASVQSEKSAERKRQLARNNSGLSPLSGNDATLIDDELETLFSNFENRRVKNKEKFSEEEDKARRLRKEEMKVRALNRNGRVDYSIQESALDFNPINTIASHMAYWSDEDVAHFIMSQVLSNRSGTGRR